MRTKARKLRCGKAYTKSTEASAASARMSAQETTPGQTFSTAVLMSSTTSKPRTEFLLGAASFSLCMLSLLSSRMEPSQPYNTATKLIIRCPRHSAYD